MAAARTVVLLLAALVLIPSMAGADYRADFEREFLTKPWAGDQVEESACISCHTYEEQVKNVPPGWKATLHYLNNVSCHDCHGGDPKDPSMSMSHQRGFVGVPSAEEVPEFCGKCHIGILNNYIESGHGKALKSRGTGPNCVTCHGAHKGGRYIQKASIDIINERLCSQCHSYDRAKEMKQALFLVEKKIEKIENDMATLKNEGFFSHQEESKLFSTHADFRALFHSIDVQLVKARTDEFMSRLDDIENNILEMFSELQFRKNFSAFMALLFAGMFIVVFFISKTPED